MAREKCRGRTPLTEPQARALASWWGGQYQRVQPRREGSQLLHGVKLLRPRQSRAASPSHEEMVIYFWEEAGSLEHRRNGVNPGAPDWPG